MIFRNALLAALAVLALSIPAAAQNVVDTCGAGQIYVAGQTGRPLTVDKNGNLCNSSAGAQPTVNQGAPGAVTSGWPTIGGELTPDTTGTFTNATQTTSITGSGLDGYGTALVSISGTYGTATGVFELSDDAGTTWYPVQGSRINSCTVELGYTGLSNTNQAWTVPVSGADSFRVRSTAVASGTVNVRVSISSAVPPSSTSVCGTVTIGSQYPVGATPLTATATGTTAATTATLAGAASKTTYICGFSISADATTAVAGNATVTGTLSGSLNYIQNVGAATAAGLLSQNFNPCIPASAVNTGISVNSAAAGIAGNTAVNAWGYQL